METKTIDWKAEVKKAKSMGDILDLVQKVKTKEDADLFMQEYEKITDTPEIARINIGYGIGYFSREEMERLYPLFPGCNHPYFGPQFGRGYCPTPEESFRIGVRIGTEALIEDRIKKRKAKNAGKGS